MTIPAERAISNIELRWRWYDGADVWELEYRVQLAYTDDFDDEWMTWQRVPRVKVANL